MPNKIRFGLIGCSRISSQHLGSMQLYKDKIELKAVCDRSKEVADEFAKKYKCDAYDDYHQMLERDDIDVVSICTPNGLHAEMAIATAKSGKHALVEKPISTNLQDTDAMIKTFADNNKKLFVVKQVRYTPALMVIKDAIDKGRLGKLYSGNLTVRWTRPQEYFAKSPWKGTKKLDGGTLLNQGDHYIDVLQWFFGPVDNVIAKIDTVAHDIELEDEAFAIIKFKNGAYANIEFTINTYPHNMECSMTVLGEKGTIKIGGKAVDEIEYWEVADYPQPPLQDNMPPEVYESGLFQGVSPRHVFVYKNLVKSLEDKENVAMDGQEARKSLEISEAIYRSAKTRQEVKIS